MKTAIISGVNGQDGSYLAELLLSKDYYVAGILRRSSTDSCERIKHLLDNNKLKIVEGDITDSSSVNSWFREFMPQEFYNLAAQSHVGTSFKQPQLTLRVNAEGVVNILEAIKEISPSTRMYQASTSEMFGKNFTTKYMFNNEVEYLKMDPKDREKKVQNENTRFAPQSPYGVAKVAAHQSVQMYRDAYNIHASAGILFNHESERRGEQFVTRKITKWLGEFIRWRNRAESPVLNGSIIECGDNNTDYIKCIDNTGTVNQNYYTFPKLRLGNLDAYRDWGHAEDYVRAMWMMLQQEKPDDYVICTGKTYSVEEFLRLAFKEIGIKDPHQYIVQDPEFMRPAEVDYLCGDNPKAKKVLGWEPLVTFEELVHRMVKSDINRSKDDR